MMNRIIGREGDSPHVLESLCPLFIAKDWGNFDKDTLLSALID